MRLRRLFWSPRKRHAEAELRTRVQRLLAEQDDHDRQRRIQLIHQTLC